MKQIIQYIMESYFPRKQKPIKQVPKVFITYWPNAQSENTLPVQTK